MERQGKLVEITEKAIELLTEKGYSPTYGARFLKRHIDQKVKLPITNEWKAGDAIYRSMRKTAKSWLKRWTLLV